MTVIDNRGRLFGAINLVDAAVIGFLIVLIPIAYGTYLLFRPVKPRIDSVSLAVITKEENRIAGGALLTAKLKVKGTGFNPLLRAQIGNTAALGFVFESPNSADVLVGQVGADDHDLILFDGIQEVARAAGAFKLPASQPGNSTYIRGAGLFLTMSPEIDKTLRVGFKFPEAEPDFEVIALGQPQPARATVRFGASQFDAPAHGLVERGAVLRIRCNTAVADNPCAVGARNAAQAPAPVTVTFSNSSGGTTAVYQFTVHEIFPDRDGQRLRLQLHLENGPHLASLKVGDRDGLLDQRAAIVTAIGSRSADAVTVTVELGADEARDGWRYRDQRLKPGAPFALVTERYQANGRIDSVEVRPAERGASQ